MKLRRFIRSMFPKPVRSRIRSIISKIDAQNIPLPQQYIPREIQRPNPCKGTVIVTGFGSWGFSGSAKVRPNIFFPPFVYSLYRQGIEVLFIKDIDEFLRVTDQKNVVVVHIFTE